MKHDPETWRANLKAEPFESWPAEERRAAVALLLRFETGAPEVLLIRRAERPGDRWSGQIGLPGGHEEAGDADLLATALRETREEVGIDLSTTARLLGRLPRVQAKARGRRLPMGIAPFVFTQSRAVSLDLGVEAQAAFWFPLQRAASGELDQPFRYEQEGVVLKLPSWRYEEHVVWGLTLEMLRSFFQSVSLR